MAITRKPIIREIATIPASPNTLEINRALIKTMYTTKAKMMIAATMDTLSANFG